MKQKHSFFVTVGIPSLFLIFSVLVLSVLALLTLGNSRNSLNTAKHSLEQTEKYYKACSNATETVSQIRSWAGQFAEGSASEEEYFPESDSSRILKALLPGTPPSILFLSRKRSQIPSSFPLFWSFFIRQKKTPRLLMSFSGIQSSQVHGHLTTARMYLKEANEHGHPNPRILNRSRQQTCF